MFSYFLKSRQGYGVSYVFRAQFAPVGLFLFLALVIGQAQASAPVPIPGGHVTIIIDDLEIRPSTKGEFGQVHPGLLVASAPITIAPNPAVETLTISPDAGVVPTHLTIQSLTGQTLFSSAIQGGGSYTAYLDPGVYTFLITTETGLISERVQILAAN